MHKITKLWWSWFYINKEILLVGGFFYFFSGTRNKIFFPGHKSHLKIYCVLGFTNGKAFLWPQPLSTLIPLTSTTVNTHSSGKGGWTQSPRGEGGGGALWKYTDGGVPRHITNGVLGTGTIPKRGSQARARAEKGGGGVLGTDTSRKGGWALGTDTTRKKGVLRTGLVKNNWCNWRCTTGCSWDLIY